MAPTAVTTTDSGLAVRLAAISSFGAAVIHIAVLPAHWQEWAPAGLFFASIALFQLIWAFLAPVRPAAAVLLSGILVNLGAAGLWALSRTAGAPFGPHAGEPEVVEAAGICALLLECYVVMGAGWVWSRSRRAAQIPAFGDVAVSLGASVVIAAAATAGVTSGLQHGHHGTAEADHRAPSISHQEGRHDHPQPVAPPAAEVKRAPAAPAPAPAVDSSHDAGGDHHHHGE